MMQFLRLLLRPAPQTEAEVLEREHQRELERVAQLEREQDEIRTRLCALGIEARVQGRREQLGAN